MKNVKKVKWTLYEVKSATINLTACVKFDTNPITVYAVFENLISNKYYLFEGV